MGGFDPEGDGPEFSRDHTGHQLPPAEAQAFAINMANVRRARKPKKDKKPNETQVARGLRSQQHMNATQFREPEDGGINPNYVPPAPGTPGGPPLPRNKDEETKPEEGTPEA